MEELSRDIDAAQLRMIAIGGTISSDDLAMIEAKAHRLLTNDARTGLFGRVFGFSPAAIVVVVQLILLLLKLVRQIRSRQEEGR